MGSTKKRRQRKPKIEKDPKILNHLSFKEQELKALEACHQQAIEETNEKNVTQKEKVNEFHPRLFERFGGFLDCNN